MTEIYCCILCGKDTRRRNRICRQCQGVNHVQALQREKDKEEQQRNVRYGGFLILGCGRYPDPSNVSE